MTKTQKALLVTAAVTGLVGGAFALAKVNVGGDQVTAGNDQSQNVVGKQAPVTAPVRSSCNGCGGRSQ